jgi:hypothetical protein
MSIIFEGREHIFNDFGRDEAGRSHPFEEFLERGEVHFHARHGSPQGFTREPIF